MALACLCLVALLVCCAARAAEPVALQAPTFRLELAPDGHLARLVDRNTGRDRASAQGVGAVCALRKDGRQHAPTALWLRQTLWGPRLRVEFGEVGVTAGFRVRRGRAFVSLELASLDPPDGVDEVTLCRLGTDAAQTIAWGPNAAYDEEFAIAVTALQPHVRASAHRRARRSARPGVTQRLSRETSGAVLTATAIARYGPLVGSGVAIVAAPRAEFTRAIAEMERACGLPSPRLSGAWGKESPDVQRDYLFITRFAEADTDAVIAAAQRGGFAYVLIGQGSWCTSTGHFPINAKSFPGGIRSLRHVVRRFHRAGLKVGLHFLAAGISPNDAYVRPIPDSRLVRDASATLAKPVDEKADRIELLEPPKDFPGADGGYQGKGTVVQIGEELVFYAERSLAPPALLGCRRGYHGTKAARHGAGETVHHLHRSYGYFLHDADAGLTDEVAQRVADVANACNVDMLYFDGSERLQGEHWFHNAKLQMAYAEKLRRRDVLLQGSSYSHFSWHALSRHASADGHGDLKRYLDERLPAFPGYRANLMPLDLGWYYIYDPALALDQIEYVLGKSLGFGCSVSLQTSPQMLREHPRMAEILDLAAAYGRLRLAGAFPDDVLARLRQPGVEFRLRGDILVRAIYEPERLLAEPGSWTVTNDGPDDPCQLAGEILLAHLVRPGDEYEAGIVLDDFEDPGAMKPRGTKRGTTQSFEYVSEGAHSGQRCFRYTAVSPTDPSGWSCVGRTFGQPLDLSSARGLGYWLKGAGEGNRALFKVQLLDDKGQPQDYYTATDFDGWRYIQLERPEKGRLDWSRVKRLNLYYNGLPAKATITVLVDGLRAIPRLATGQLDHPQLQVGETTVTFPVRLEPGHALVFDADRVVVRGPGGTVAAEAKPQGARLQLPHGASPLRFACRGPMARAVRLRLARVYPTERYQAKPDQ